MRPEPVVVVEDSAEALAAQTAQRTVVALAAALRARPVAHLVVTGGGILEQVLDALALPDLRSAIDWARVHVWWGDERYVPGDSEDRNDLHACAKLFDHVGIDPAKLHRMPASDSRFGASAEAAAASYAAELAAAGGDEDIPRFDVILLGVGPDGHCASLFPGHPGVRELDAAAIAVRDAPKPPPIRLSLTFRALDAANEVWIIAAGEGKAQAVAAALGGAPREQVPCAGPRGRDHTLWLIDRAAAGKIPPAS